MLCGVLLALAVLPAAARELQLQVGAVRNDVASLEDVQVSLDWPEGAAAGELSLRAARLQVPAIGQDLRAVQWRCPLSRDADGQWQCEGAVASQGGSGSLAVSLSAASIDAMLCPVLDVPGDGPEVGQRLVADELDDVDGGGVVLVVVHQMAGGGRRMGGEGGRRWQR